MSDVLLYEVDEAVATLTLNRPEQLNALNRELSEAYMEAVQRARRDDAVRVVVVTGAGRAFCAGVDLKARAANEAGGPAPNFFAMLRGESQYDTVMEKPLIAAINGYCLAGGLELALTCDLRIAAEGSRFGMPEIRRGFFPGGGGPQRLPRMVPQALALEMLLTGDQYDATEMRPEGVVLHRHGDAAAASVAVWLRPALDHRADRGRERRAARFRGEARAGVPGTLSGRGLC
jgi:enoyl-CoA hydratase/carnithine racemase